MFPGKPEHLDERARFPAARSGFAVSIVYRTPEEGRYFASLFQKGAL
jgi:hypothetical protein